MTTRARPEDQIHKSILTWIHKHSPCPVWHTPNGGSRHVLEAINLKQLGTEPGVADLFVLAPNGIAHFIEVKAPGGQQSPEQKAFERKITACQARYGVAHSRDEAIELFRSWGLPFSELLWDGARPA